MIHSVGNQTDLEMQAVAKIRHSVEMQSSVIQMIHCYYLTLQECLNGMDPHHSAAKLLHTDGRTYLFVVRHYIPWPVLLVGYNYITKHDHKSKNRIM